MSHDPHVTLEVVGLLPLGADEAPLENGLLAQSEEGVEGVDLGVSLANLILSELSLGLAEPVDPNESVHDCVVIFVFENLFYLKQNVFWSLDRIFMIPLWIKSGVISHYLDHTVPSCSSSSSS